MEEDNYCRDTGTECSDEISAARSAWMRKTFESQNKEDAGG
jgi:hypothetical protein